MRESHPETFKLQMWYYEFVREKGKNMCKFCEPTEFEKKTFYNWSNYNPYEDEEQAADWGETDYIPDWEGIDFILDNRQFIISCSFDSGYIGDKIEITFNYCPVCGKKI